MRRRVSVGRFFLPAFLSVGLSGWLSVGGGPARPDRREPATPGRGPRGRGPGRRRRRRRFPGCCLRECGALGACSRGSPQLGAERKAVGSDSGRGRACGGGGRPGQRLGEGEPARGRGPGAPGGQSRSSRFPGAPGPVRRAPRSCKSLARARAQRRSYRAVCVIVELWIYKQEF
nr:serine/arginine-rich splicing factor SR45-like [Macaca fascicularis]